MKQQEGEKRGWPGTRDGLKPGTAQSPASAILLFDLVHGPVARGHGPAWQAPPPTIITNPITKLPEDDRRPPLAPAVRSPSHTVGLVPGNLFLLFFLSLLYILLHVSNQHCFVPAPSPLRRLFSYYYLLLTVQSPSN